MVVQTVTRASEFPQSKRPQRVKPHVRVEPANDEMRRLLRHMPTRIGFRETGSASWPLDAFTKRRLRDGDIKLVEEKKDEHKPTGREHRGEQHQHPQQGQTRQSPQPQQPQGSEQGDSTP